MRSNSERKLQRNAFSKEIALIIKTLKESIKIVAHFEEVDDILRLMNHFLADGDFLLL